MSKVYFGIDLGTSCSSISYIVDSQRIVKSSYVEPNTIRLNPPDSKNIYRLPSIVYIENKQNRLRIAAGFEAEETALGKLAKPFYNLFMSVKSDMGTLKIYEDSVHPGIFTPVAVSAEIIKQLIKAAEKDTGVSPRNCNVVITVPASFMHNQRQDTIKAARMAGLNVNEGDLLDEPIAVFIHTACNQKLDAQLDMKHPKNILMFDLGAGTCDISIFQASYTTGDEQEGIGLEIKNRAISNYEKLGGDNIDLHIVEKEILPLFCEKNSIDFGSLPERVKREVRFKLKMQAKKLKERICRSIIQDEEGKDSRQTWAIDSLPISSLGVQAKKVRASLSIERFVELMEPFVSEDIERSFRMTDDYFTYSFFAPVVNALFKTNMEPEELDAVIFNGGSCHNPLIKKAVESFDGFSNARFFETPDLDLSVAKGAALHCFHLYRNKRPIVAPIVSSEIGIYTLGLKPEKLIDAGTELPFPKEGFSVKQDFFIPKDNIDYVGISIYSGNKPKRRVISNLKLHLPEGIKKGEPVSIGLRINSNKLMNFTACLSNNPGIKIEAELSNPWTHDISTPEDIAVSELWKEVYDMKKQRLHVSADTMVEIANRERLRSNCDSALEILQRLEDKEVTTSGACNIMALCYNRKGRREKALDYFKRASEMKPDDATLAANYGSQLFESGRVEEGISRLRLAVDIDSDNYFPYYWLGYAYRKAGNEEQAFKEYHRARQLLRNLVSKHPESEWHLDLLEDVHVALGEYEEADRVKKQLQNVRNSKVLGGSPEKLLAGPESGIWKEADIFEDKENS